MVKKHARFRRVVFKYGSERSGLRKIMRVGFRSKKVINEIKKNDLISSRKPDLLG